MRYKHYKGSEYEFITEATDADTLEVKVVFKNINTNKVWLRPASEFYGVVEINGKWIDRFTKLVDQS